ncbi:MAG: VWA domain-containing protein [Pseudobacteriovorax sp.]|nr:VWA domain-containing protein [Pseudobacteriovorax sp.]
MKYSVYAFALACAIGCTKKNESTPKSTPEAPKESKPEVVNKLGPVYNWPPASQEPFDVLPENRHLAKNYYIILDGSGSMKEGECAEGRSKYDVAVNALQTFAKSVPEDDNLGMLVFDSTGIKEVVPLGINNRDLFYGALAEVKVGGGTPLGSAISQGKAKLEGQARSQLGYGEFNLIIVTDGEADRNDSPNKAVQYLINNTPIIVQTIGFCIDDNHALNKPNKTVYKSANNPSELVSSLESILAESEVFTDTDFGE